MAKAEIRETASGDINRGELIALYRLMVLIRRFEETTYKKYREGKMGGYLHRYDGQESLVVGIIPLLQLPGDYILCTYRDHAHALACGTDPKAVMAELMGRVTGCAGGKGGSMHLIDPQRGFLGGDGIVGGAVSVFIRGGEVIKFWRNHKLSSVRFGGAGINAGRGHRGLTK